MRTIDRDVRTMFPHNKWKTFKSSSRNLVERNLEMGQYDVALISLKQPIEYSMHVIPICLSDDDNILVGEEAWVKGFGRIGASKYLFTISNYGPCFNYVSMLLPIFDQLSTLVC